MTKDNSVTQLAPEYQFTYDDIQPNEINDLRQAFGWNPDSSERWRECLNTSIVVGIRSNDELVSVGFIAGNSRHGVLCDITIAPEHKDNGLGEAVINETLRLAKIRGMRYFYVHMSQPSPLRDVYLKLGFKDTGGSLFRNDNLTNN